MLRDDGLTTAEIGTLFAEEITAAGGSVTDGFDDGRRLLARSVLPWLAEVRPRDRVQGGVALRAAGPDVWVHPYVFRLVCSNGAIMAQAIQTEHIERIDTLTPEEAGEAIREAIRACCVEEAFTDSAHAIRTAQTSRADLALSMLPHLSKLPEPMRAHILGVVLDRFTRAGDTSRFGLVNAVTSVARDTPDADLRWRLEEVGGYILAGDDPKTRLCDHAALASA